MSARIAPTAQARHRARRLGAHLLLATTLAAASRACLINPQKDYPVGGRVAATGGNGVADGGAGQGTAQGNGGEFLGAPGGGADGFGGAPASGGAGASSSAGAVSPACNAETECSIGKVCKDQRCQCVACPRGGLAGLPDTFCTVPVNAVATGSVPPASTETPEQAIDGDANTAWASGDYAGNITISFPTPQPVAALVLYPEVSPGNVVVNYAISVHSDGGAVEMLTAQFTTARSQAWLRVPLSTPAIVTDITVDAHSRATDTWIALKEILVVACASD